MGAPSGYRAQRLAPPPARPRAPRGTAPAASDHRWLRRLGLPLDGAPHPLGQRRALRRVQRLAHRRSLGPDRGALRHRHRRLPADAVVPGLGCWSRWAANRWARPRSTCTRGGTRRPSATTSRCSRCPARVAARAIVLAAPTRPRARPPAPRGRGRVGGRRSRRHRRRRAPSYAATLPIQADAGVRRGLPGGQRRGELRPRDDDLRRPGGGRRRNVLRRLGRAADGAGRHTAGACSWAARAGAACRAPRRATRPSSRGCPPSPPGSSPCWAERPRRPAGAAAAVTGPATDVAGTSATLNGTVDPDGLATDYRIEVGATTAYGTIVARGYAGAGHGPVAVSAPVAGLSSRWSTTTASWPTTRRASPPGPTASWARPRPRPPPRPRRPGRRPESRRPPSRPGRTARPAYLHRGKRRTACLTRQRQLRALARLRQAAHAEAPRALPGSGSGTRTDPAARDGVGARVPRCPSRTRSRTSSGARPWCGSGASPRGRGRRSSASSSR